MVAGKNDNAMRYKIKRFSEESRIRKMKGKLLLDDLGTETGIHPLYRKAKEKVTGEKTLYHYTPTRNVESILKEGFDPGKDRYSSAVKAAIGKDDFDAGVYFGNQSKAIPRSTASNRYKTEKIRRKEGKPPKDWNDPGVMMTVKIPMKEYKRMKKRESDPLIDIPGGHKNIYKTNKYYRKDYDSKGPLGKLGMRYRVNRDFKHFKKDVVLLQEKVDPKYITKVDKDWS